MDVRQPVDPLWLAMSHLRRRKFKSAVDIADSIIRESGPDVAAIFVKTRALTAEVFVDESEQYDEEGIGELLLDDNSTAVLPRPGTSLNTAAARGNGPDQSVRPVSTSGRPLTGFSRPMSGRPMSGISVESAFKGSGTAARPATTLGREVRMATASLAMDGSANLDLNRLNLQRVAQRPALAAAIADYCVHVAADPKRALELGAECTRVAGFKDWWWKLVVGRAYHKLGLFREAERQFKSSLREQDMIVTHLELVKVLIRLDQPKTALQHLSEASLTHPGEPRLPLSSARIHNMLGNSEEAAAFYREVLTLDAANVESIACLAAIFFYSDQPEIALRYYRRLLQMGCQSTELWNNLGLCCFHSSQYDMALGLFERALEHADETNAGDVWFNIGHIAIGIGDLSLAYQALKVATSMDPSHAESLNNLAVLESRKKNKVAAHADFRLAQRSGPHLFEPLFNSALLAHKAGEITEALALVKEALGVYPEHADSLELLKQLNACLT